MDPDWDACPYCEAEQKSNQRSTGVQSDPFDRQRTVVGSPRPSAPGAPEPQRDTRAMTAPLPPGGYAGSGDTRRITGVLVTYTRQRQGEVFMVREGKTFIGSGNISSEADHRPCDVCIPGDVTMSAEHALILCRQGHYEILDQISSNGTFLSRRGEAKQMLKANQGTELPNYAEITTGKTEWTFIMITPPADQAAPPGPGTTPPPPTPPKEGDTIVR